MYSTPWYPESSCAIDANQKQVDRQWLAQELIFYFINKPARAVQFDNITSTFSSVAAFCYRFPQVGTNHSSHKELPISSLVHTLNDNSISTTFYPTIAFRWVLHRTSIFQYPFFLSLLFTLSQCRTYTLKDLQPKSPWSVAYREAIDCGPEH